jgi:diacylglycerol kinase (ATP)
MPAASDRGVMVNSTQKNRSFAVRLGYAINGLVHALRSERSLRTQLAVLLAVVVVLFVLQPAPIWWALVLFASCAVMAAELFNTAIERLADHLHPEQHPEIRIVKDCAAAAVLMIVAGALMVAAAYVIERLHLP